MHAPPFKKAGNEKQFPWEAGRAKAPLKAARNTLLWSEDTHERAASPVARPGSQRRRF